jgi:Tol biopolymer transport system component
VFPLDRGAGESAELTSDLSRVIVRTEVDRASGLFDVDLVDVRSGSKTKLISAADEPAGFVWSPNGRRIAYVDGINGTDAIKVIDSDGFNQITLFSEQISGLFSIIGWTQDGESLVYQRSEVVSRFVRGASICFVAVDGSENDCFDPRFWGNQDGPTSPTILLN